MVQVDKKMFYSSSPETFVFKGDTRGPEYQMPDHRTGQVTYMREAGYVFRTQEVRHEGALQATAGYSNQETIEEGGDCDK